MTRWDRKDSLSSFPSGAALELRCVLGLSASSVRPKTDWKQERAEFSLQQLSTHATSYRSNIAVIPVNEDCDKWPDYLACPPSTQLPGGTSLCFPRPTIHKQIDKISGWINPWNNILVPSVCPSCQTQGLCYPPALGRFSHNKKFKVIINNTLKIHIMVL